MRFIITIVAALITMTATGQDFATKPFTVSEQWIKGQLTISQIKSQLPEGYEVTLEESDKLVLEKTIGPRVYDIKVFYDNKGLNGIMFTQHIDRVYKLMDEIEKNLGYKMSSSDVFNGIETNDYDHPTTGMTASMSINESKRFISCFIARKNN